MKNKRRRLIEKNVLMFLENKTNRFENKIALGTRTQYGWKEFTYKGVGLLSRKIANWMIKEAGLKIGDRVAVICESKPEFGACFFASALSGTVFTPLDIKLTEHELCSILSDCKPRVLFVSANFISTGQKLKEKLDFIEELVLMDDSPQCGPYKTIYNFENNYEGKFRRRNLRSGALLIYTSGTTGSPKGVEISYLNMITQLESLEWVKDYIFPEYGREDISVLSILPMNHLFELTVGFSLFMNWGLSIYYTQSLRPKDILSTMCEKNVHFMIVVPAFLKLLKSSIENKINTSPPFIRTKFKLMYHLAKFIPFTGIKRLMFKNIHNSFGGKFTGCITGGAPLDINVGKFFERIGIKVFHGYGLSETSPVVSVNCENRHNLASVGRPLKCFEAKIDKNTGELLLRGLSVMKGYYNRPDLTNEVIDKDGWLHTGDIAKLDKDNYLYITGRIKSMIVLSGGKKVFPEEVESVLEKSPKFKELCVFGIKNKKNSNDNSEDIAIAILPSDDIAQLDNLYDIVRQEVKQLSQKLAPYKRPVNIYILKEPLPRTTTRKVKRNSVKELAAVK